MSSFVDSECLRAVQDYKELAPQIDHWLAAMRRSGRAVKLAQEINEMKDVKETFSEHNRGNLPSEGYSLFSQINKAYNILRMHPVPNTAPITIDDDEVKPEVPPSRKSPPVTAEPENFEFSRKVDNVGGRGIGRGVHLASAGGGLTARRSSVEPAWLEEETPRSQNIHRRSPQSPSKFSASHRDGDEMDDCDVYDYSAGGAGDRRTRAPPGSGETKYLEKGNFYGEEDRRRRGEVSAPHRPVPSPPPAAAGSIRTTADLNRILTTIIPNLNLEPPLVNSGPPQNPEPPRMVLLTGLLINPSQPIQQVYQAPEFIPGFQASCVPPPLPRPYANIPPHPPSIQQPGYPWPQNQLPGAPSINIPRAVPLLTPEAAQMSYFQQNPPPPPPQPFPRPSQSVIQNGGRGHFLVQNNGGPWPPPVPPPNIRSQSSPQSALTPEDFQPQLSQERERLQEISRKKAADCFKRGARSTHARGNPPHVHRRSSQSREQHDSRNKEICQPPPQRLNRIRQVSPPAPVTVPASNSPPLETERSPPAASCSRPPNPTAKSSLRSRLAEVPSPRPPVATVPSLKVLQAPIPPAPSSQPPRAKLPTSRPPASASRTPSSELTPASKSKRDQELCLREETRARLMLKNQNCREDNAPQQRPVKGKPSLKLHHQSMVHSNGRNSETASQTSSGSSSKSSKSVAGGPSKSRKLLVSRPAAASKAKAEVTKTSLPSRSRSGDNFSKNTGGKERSSAKVPESSRRITRASTRKLPDKKEDTPKTSAKPAEKWLDLFGDDSDDSADSGETTITGYLRRPPTPPILEDLSTAETEPSSDPLPSSSPSDIFAVPEITETSEVPASPPKDIEMPPLELGACEEPAAIRDPDNIPVDDDRAPCLSPQEGPPLPVDTGSPLAPPIVNDDILNYLVPSPIFFEEEDAAPAKREEITEAPENPEPSAENATSELPTEPSAQGVTTAPSPENDDLLASPPQSSSNLLPAPDVDGDAGPDAGPDASDFPPPLSKTKTEPEFEFESTLDPALVDRLKSLSEGPDLRQLEQLFPDNPEGRWGCVFCAFRCHCPEQYFEHLTTHTGEFRYKCGRCEETGRRWFATKEEVEVHRNVFEHAPILENYPSPVFLEDEVVMTGYLCDDQGCNYFQMRRENMDRHCVETGHSPEWVMTVDFKKFTVEQGPEVTPDSNLETEEIEEASEGSPADFTEATVVPLTPARVAESEGSEILVAGQELPETPPEIELLPEDDAAGDKEVNEEVDEEVDGGNADDLAPMLTRPSLVFGVQGPSNTGQDCYLELRTQEESQSTSNQYRKPVRFALKKKLNRLQKPPPSSKPLRIRLKPSSSSKKATPSSSLPPPPTDLAPEQEPESDLVILAPSEELPTPPLFVNIDQEPDREPRSPLDPEIIVKGEFLENEDDNEKRPPPPILNCHKCRAFVTSSATDLVAHYVNNHRAFDLPQSQISATMKDVINQENTSGDRHLFEVPYPQWSCLFCVFIALSPVHFLEHVTSHTGEFRYKCGRCGKLFARRVDIQDHMENHDEVYRETGVEEVYGALVKGGDSEVSGYLCRCQYFQWRKENMEKHCERKGHLKEDVVQVKFYSPRDVGSLKKEVEKPEDREEIEEEDLGIPEEMAEEELRNSEGENESVVYGPALPPELVVNPEELHPEPVPSPVLEMGRRTSVSSMEERDWVREKVKSGGSRDKKRQRSTSSSDKSDREKRGKETRRSKSRSTRRSRSRSRRRSRSRTRRRSRSGSRRRSRSRSRRRSARLRSRSRSRRGIRSPARRHSRSRSRRRSESRARRRSRSKSRRRPRTRSRTPSKSSRQPSKKSKKKPSKKSKSSRKPSTSKKFTKRHRSSSSSSSRSSASPHSRPSTSKVTRVPKPLPPQSPPPPKSTSKPPPLCVTLDSDSESPPPPLPPPPIKQEAPPLAPNPDQCLHCPFTTSGEFTMVDHYVSSHSPCDIPSSHFTSQMLSDFTSQSTSRNPLSLEIRRASFSCPLCWKAFPDALQFFRHLTAHTGEYQYKCKQCRKQYPTFDKIKDHLLFCRPDDQGNCALLNYQAPVTQFSTEIELYVCNAQGCGYFQVLRDNLFRHCDQAGHCRDRMVAIKFIRDANLPVKPEPVPREPRLDNEDGQEIILLD